MITNTDIVTSPRMGGSVRRYHTWPTIQNQTVMDHTGNALRIYWQLFGEVPPQVCAYLLFHDLSEVRVGDPPHPIKLHNPQLKEIYDDLEDQTLVDMVGEERAMQILGDVTDLERARMKACDLLEMAEFASVELAMGNRMAWPILANVIAAIGGLALSPADAAMVHDHINITRGRFE